MDDSGAWVKPAARTRWAIAWLSLGATWLGCSPSPPMPNGPSAAGAGDHSAGTLNGGGGDLVLDVGNGGKTSGGAPSGGGGAAGAAGVNASGTTSADACQPRMALGCVPEEVVEASCNGSDDDCDGSIDEGCRCEPGAVQPCFLGAPTRRGVGACADGAQVCLRAGELSGRWGDCTGGIRPGDEACDGLDNDCNGCVDDLAACDPKGTCPGPGDPRTPDGTPLSPYPLRGRDFFTDPAKAWSWTVQGGPCDALNATTPSFVVDDANSETATFRPKLSGDYTVTLTVFPETGPIFTCSWIVHIQGPGLRIEMCYPESSITDLDLYVKQPGHQTPWFTGSAHFFTALDQCCWANCEANLRPGEIQPPQTVTRADWGYATSPLSLCQNDLHGDVWQSLGYCSSPRLDIDNNLSEATGVPENINVDAPRDNETFRIMVANFTGAEAHPLVNVYCDGYRTATIGAAPDALVGFSGTSGSLAIGALWRAADVTTHVKGTQTTCSVNVLHPPGSNTGFDVTQDDARY
jgi:hypothetical protein